MEEMFSDDDDLDNMQQELEDRLSSVVHEILNPSVLMRGDSDRRDKNAEQTENVEPEKSPSPQLPPPDLSKEVRGKDLIFPSSRNSKFAKFVERYVRPVTNADVRFLKRMRKKYEYTPLLTNKKVSKRAKRPKNSDQSIPSNPMNVIKKQGSDEKPLEKRKPKEKSSKKSKNDVPLPLVIEKRKSSRKTCKNQNDNVRCVPSVSIKVEYDENMETLPAERKTKRKSSKKKKTIESAPPPKPKRRKKNDTFAEHDDPNVLANNESCDEYVVSTSQRSYDDKLSKKSSENEEVLPTLIIRKVKKNKYKKKRKKKHSRTPQEDCNLSEGYTEKLATSSSRPRSDLIQEIEEFSAEDLSTEFDTDESYMKPSQGEKQDLRKPGRAFILTTECDEKSEAGNNNSPNHESNDSLATDEGNERSRIAAELKEKIARSKELSKFITEKLDSLKLIATKDVKRNALMNKMKHVEVKIIDLHLIYKYTKSLSDRKRLMDLIDQRDALISQLNKIK